MAIALTTCGANTQAATLSIAQSVLTMSQILIAIWSSTVLTVGEITVHPIYWRAT